ncbi:MAG: D-ribitol-5-phosphate cytidylyltransferase [Lachnospiraceae bacterium]|jgi:2-C-methyl-D-erythritol 4-phosphate cytidylyltransferase|nr:D-ribitol-5-phosphate cytidylyltransferase [Lachnospiraceae bacterium]
MTYAGILAAGLGVRMHRQDLPKQFLPLGEKPIIIHTLEQFFVNPGIDRIVVVAPGEWLQYAVDLLGQYNLADKEYAVISGGVNKTESIGIVARYIADKYGISAGDALVAHDAIRPFITQRIIDDHIAALLRYDAVNTAGLTNDAIIFSDDGENVDDVPPHMHMYAEQTPQSYSLPKLLELLTKAEEKKILLAKESELPRLWLRLGYGMGLVMGEYSNMKIINPYDLEVAEALLRERKL